ncbi:Membrane protein involved in the export of O-antigen and teichoic acid [Rhodopirellula islandica]|uniref:Membrane protein involved in the export of O-antigen and teichoic acid n=1 Tax=Rhodopirellula islandica TaxID=595434 RepID=A0A0J1B8Q3_RHOIS|nr:oligosaccharide flippase family protein [Rhodopirellula islandica]KLU02918.1 Membrane protein involved in the export of O-antigen and teichoic acid [Rhodopirellula islandica]
MDRIKKLEATSQNATNRKNSAWGLIDYGAQAASVICLTPLLLRELGDSAFGMLVIATTIMGLNGMLSLGLGPAAQHFVAKYRHSNESKSKLKLVVETSLIANLIFGIASCTTIILCTEAVSRLYPHPANAPPNELAFIIRLAAFGLPFVFVVNTIDNSLKGFERFELSVPLSAIARIGTAVSQISLVLLGFELAAIVFAAVAFKGIQAILGVIVLKRWALPELSILPSFSWDEFRNFVSYGVYIWLNSMVATARSSGEILILASILGPTALTLYAVPSRVLTQVHLMLSSAFAYLFPFATKLIQSGDTQRVHEVYSNATRYLCTLSGLAIPPLAIGCGPLLALWIEADRAEKIQPIFQLLAIRYAVYPLSILTSNLLMASNKTRAMTIIATANTVTILPFSAGLAYFYGAEGAAAAQLLVLAPILFNRFFVEKTLFGSASANTVALPVLLLVVPLTCFLLLVDLPVDYPLIPTAIASTCTGLICGGICWIATSQLIPKTGAEAA